MIGGKNMKVKIAAMLAAFLIAVSGALIVLNEQKWVIPKADSILPSVSASDTDNYTGNSDSGDDTETPPDEGDDGNGGGYPGGGGYTPDDTETPPEEPEVPGVMKFYSLETNKGYYELGEQVTISGIVVISNSVIPESVVVELNIYNSLTPASLSSTDLVLSTKTVVECAGITATDAVTATEEYPKICKFESVIENGFKQTGSYTVIAKASGTTTTTVVNEVTKITKFVVVQKPEVPGVIRFYTLNTDKSIYYLGEPVSIFGTILISNAVLPESVVVTFSVYNSLTPASLTSTTLVAQLKADTECTALPSATAIAETTAAQAAGYGYSCKFKAPISDGFKKEGNYVVFAKASGTTITTVINEVTKTTKFVVVQKTVPEPSEPSTLRIKAYDVNTGDLVPGAITIVLWVSDLPTTTSTTAGGTGAGGGPALTAAEEADEPVGSGSGPVPALTAAAILPSVFAAMPGDTDCDGDIDLADIVFLVSYLDGGPAGECGTEVMDVNGDCVIDNSDVKYLIEYYRGIGPAPVTPECDTPEGPVIPREGIVVGIIKANGIDSITLKPGVYNLITYAKGYTLYRHWGLLIKPGQEYGLYAPMSKGIVTKPPTVIKPITEIAIPVTEAAQGGIVVKIMPVIEKKLVEVIYPGTEAAISIRAVEEGEKGKFVLEADNIEAITDAAVEIEEKKLYIKTDEAKTQVKILPSTAAERAQEALLSHRIKTIILEIVNKKPFYTIDGEQDANMLGFIPTKIPVTTKVSAETGEITTIAKPFWAILAIPVSR